MSTPLLRCLLTMLATIAMALGHASAQCLNFEVFPGSPNGTQLASVSVTYDDGSGPALYVAGRSGETVQKFDGSQLSLVGPELTGDVFTLAALDLGIGPRLYAGGRLQLPSSYSYSGITRWDGNAWTPLDSSWWPSARVLALAVFDDGTGPAVYAAGSFSSIGGVTCRNIARWDGTAWNPLGSGLAGGYTEGAGSLVVHDDGSGPRLFAGGSFTQAGGQAAAGIAQWNGRAWSDVSGSITGGGVSVTLASFDDGTGPALFATGYFTAIGGVPVAGGLARWRGGVWSQAGTPPASVGAGSFAVVDVGAGANLYLSRPVSSSGLGRVFRWNGQGWQPLGADFRSFVSSSSYPALSVLHTASGPRLCGSGRFEQVGPYATNIAIWEPPEWKPAWPTPKGLDGTVRALASFDDGSGQALWCGGDFWSAGDRVALRLARWDGSGWRSASAQDWRAVHALAVIDLGSGPGLYAGGRHDPPDGGAFGGGIRRWTGLAWEALGWGISHWDTVFAVCGHDLGAGPQLFIGGTFTLAGGVASPHFAAWDGARWSALGNGVNGNVHALAAYGAGAGASVYLGGGFTDASGVPAQRIARWNGSTFSSVGSGMNGDVWALCVFDDGTGPLLYAAGNFTSAGGVPAQRVAAWDGSTWRAIGAGFDALVTKLYVFDDGSGPALYAAGDFTHSGAAQVLYVARWGGTSWSPLGAGIGGSVYALASHRDGTGIGPKLFAGGRFDVAATLASKNLAAWRGCEGPISRFCAGDGTSAACPCGNTGLPGRGCNNSVDTGGARLNATGTTGPDTLVLYCGGVLPNAATLVFQGDTVLTAPVPFGDGLRCVGGSLRRLYTMLAMAGSISVPGLGQDLVSVRSAALGDPLLPGSVRGYQVWYRDADPAFCTPPSGSASNLSNAVRIVW